MIQAFQGGLAYQGDDDAGSETNDQLESDGYSPSDGIGSTDIHPPSSEDNRQDVLLFHLDDHPVHALISWNSYEDMMSEIAHHFALERSDLVDAYEVVIQPPDIGHENVPTIVHVQDDVRPGSGDRLILLDVEYHAHRIEANFRLGLTVVRKVIPISRNAHRNEVRCKANIRYCRAESGRCLVFINSSRWPDCDLDRKTISHGDYIRIAVPPSERFSCPTTDISDMTQRGFTDQQIFDEMSHDDAESGVSPSLLGEDEVRGLASETQAEDDDVMMMQRQLIESAQYMQTPDSVTHAYSSHGRAFADQKVSRPGPSDAKCSLTDESIRFVQAVGSQVDNPDTLVDEPSDLRDQPMRVQDLWDKWVETMAQTGRTIDEGLRIETWFSNPRRWSRCQFSRVVVLSSNFHCWERELLAAWPDRAELALLAQFAIVFPTPEDVDSTVQEQFIMEQQPEPFSRSVVSTLY